MKITKTQRTQDIGSNPGKNLNNPLFIELVKIRYPRPKLQDQEFLQTPS